jgi:putative ABC transport system substrate-binding protein
MIERRRFLLGSGAGALMVPLAPLAQPHGKVWRIGFLGLATASGYAGWADALREGLRDLGYIEGKNIAIEFRAAEGNYGRLPQLAAELVALKVDVIVTYGTPGARATTSIPIVMAFSGDPVATGLVAALARPGGNVTGISGFGPEISAKRLELLKDALPRIRRVAVLLNPNNLATAGPVFQAVQATAASLKLELQKFEVRDPGEFDSAFAAMAKSRVDAVVVLDEAVLAGNIGQIAKLAAKNRLPRARGSRRPAGVWTGPSRRFSPRGHVRGQNYQGRETRGPSGRTADQVRDGGEHEDRPSTRRQDSRLDHGARGEGDRVSTRRRIVLAIGACAFTAPFAINAQPARRTPLLAYVANRPGPMEFDQAFLRGLREFGYVEGQNIRIEYRWGEGMEGRLPAQMQEAIGLNPDIIVTASSQAAPAAKSATATIPIVMTSSSDAVRDGLVASFARPGGNVTGMSIFTPESIGKRLELLKETLPKLTRVATIWNSANQANVPMLRDSEAAAKVLGLALHSVGVRQVAELDMAFANIVRVRAGALSVLSDGFMFTNRNLVSTLAARHRLPAIYPSSAYVEAGGLMSYGPSIAAAYHRAAYFVDRILKGARPADLPVEQPIIFEMVVNMKTAKALGVKIPGSIMVRAERVIK